MPCVIRELSGHTSSVLRAETQITSVSALLRELVQNAVDADARRVRVVADLRNWRVMVSDDGCGISAANLDVLGRKTHFTSKIKRLEDLVIPRDQITYGFRGEALYSISKVSELTLVSRLKGYRAYYWRTISSPETIARILSLDQNHPKEDNTFELLGKFGGSVSEWDSGTTVLVNNLFSNLPVRRAVLDGSQDMSLIELFREELLQILINNPQITIQVYVLNRNAELEPIFDFRPDLLTDSKLGLVGDLYSIFTKLYGKIVPDSSLKKVRLNFKEYQLTGIISNYQVKTKDYQIVYFNGRRYRNKKLFSLIGDLVSSSTFMLTSKSVVDGRPSKKSYRGYLLLILYIKGPLTIQDLIQDPSKKIYQLKESKLVNGLIIKIIHSFLRSQGFLDSPFIQAVQSFDSDSFLTMDVLNQVNNSDIRRSPSPNYILEANVKMAKYGKRPIDSLEFSSRKSIKIEGQRSPKKFDLSNLVLGVPSKTDFTPNFLHNSCQYSSEYVDFVIDRAVLGSLMVIGQVDKKFILLKQNFHPMNIYVIDQHACDERIRLENLLQGYISSVLNKTLSVRKLFNCKIQIAEAEGTLFKKYSDEFINWGIYYEPVVIKHESYLNILGLPDFLLNNFSNEKLKESLLEHLFDLKENKKIRLASKAKNLKSQGKHTWWNYTIAIPNFIRDYFNTKACRSSIMFGDDLRREECVGLVERLRNCSQPYYCAHGRPSIVKVMDIQSSSLVNKKTFIEDYQW